MPYKRNWDSSCPRVYTRWESGGVSWVTQDLPPEDDEEALQLLMKYMLPDEVLCTYSDFLNDKESMEAMERYWRVCLAQRLSIACYAEKNGERTLAGLNCCIVQQKGDDGPIYKIYGESWTNVWNAMGYASSKVDVYKKYGVDTVYYGMGLVVRKDFRGAKLGAKILEARKPICDHLGIKVTSTVFTGPASQKCAAAAGFETLVAVSIKELAEAGLRYPPEDKVIKVMAKRYSF